MAALSLLVVAPDLELRRSLEFALKAEGYAVTAVPDIATARALAGRFDCTVLDAAAADDPLADAVGFCAHARPVVLLSDTAVPILGGWIAGMVEKPQLGQALTAAVQRAVPKGPTAAHTD